MTSNETIVRAAFDALAQGDVGTMLESVDPNLEWTFLDPSEEDPSRPGCATVASNLSAGPVEGRKG